MAELIVTTPGPDLGRFGTGLPSDQALGVIALSRTNGGAPAETVDYLVERRAERRGHAS